MTMVASAAFVSRRSRSAREPMVVVTDVPQVSLRCWASVLERTRTSIDRSGWAASTAARTDAPMLPDAPMLGGISSSEGS